MEFKGTKGKWDVSGKIGTNNYGVKFLTIDFEDAKDCIDIYVDKRYPEYVSFLETQANALLISKAPEMLEMLKDIKDYLGSDKREQVEQLIKEATEF
jgi:hypothetical protein